MTASSRNDDEVVSFSDTSRRNDAEMAVSKDFPGGCAHSAHLLRYGFSRMRFGMYLVAKPCIWAKWAQLVHQLRWSDYYNYLLVYTGSGNGYFTVGDQSFSVEKGDFTWVPPDTYVRMEGDASDMRCVYIHFDLMFDPERSRWNAIIPGGTTDLTSCSGLMHPEVDDPGIRGLTGRIPEGASRKASDLLIQICFEYRRSAEPDHLLLSGMALQLISELLSINMSGSSSLPKHWRTLAEAERCIHNRLDGDLNTAELAARFRLSGSHFRKIFREKYGVSPGKMHRRLRIQKGCELLVYSDLNVSETAFALGFSTVHSFSKAFREITGVSPTEYKRGGN